MKSLYRSQETLQKDQENFQFRNPDHETQILELENPDAQEALQMNMYPHRNQLREILNPYPQMHETLILVLKNSEF